MEIFYSSIVQKLYGFSPEMILFFPLVSNSRKYLILIAGSILSNCLLLIFPGIFSSCDPSLEIFVLTAFLQACRSSASSHQLENVRRDLQCSRSADLGSNDKFFLVALLRI